MLISSVFFFLSLSIRNWTNLGKLLYMVSSMQCHCQISHVGCCYYWRWFGQPPCRCSWAMSTQSPLSNSHSNGVRLYQPCFLRNPLKCPATLLLALYSRTRAALGWLPHIWAAAASVTERSSQLSASSPPSPLIWFRCYSVRMWGCLLLWMHASA